MNGRLINVHPVNQLLKAQAVIVAFSGLIFFWIQGEFAALSSVYGGSIALGGTFLQKWHLIGAAKQAKSDAGMNLRKAYRCVAERWLLTIVMFAVGFTVMDLLPLPLMTGFVVTQVALLTGNMKRV